MGFLQGQEVVLPVIAADPDIQPVSLEGQDILGRFFFELVPVVAADEVHLFHFRLDIGDFVLRTRVFQGVFQRIEVIQMLLVLFVELGRHLLAIAHLGVALVIAIGIIRHGIGRVQGDGHFFLCF